MSTVFASLMPVFLVILCGWGARAGRLVDEASWPGFERVTYQILFPAVVIHTLALARVDQAPFAQLAITLGSGVGLLVLLLLALRRWLLARGIDGPAFTSVLQGAVRWNTFVALAVSAQLFGERGVALIAIAIATLIPMLNILCVLALARYAGTARPGPRALLKTLASNPFVWSCAVGIALNPVGAMLPGVVATALEVMGRASLATGLLVVGAGLRFDRLARPGLAHALSTALKLIALPMIALTVGRAVGLMGPDLAVALIAASVPTASAAYILARQLGGDAPLMAEITTLQTLLSLATMPVFIALALL